MKESSATVTEHLQERERSYFFMIKGGRCQLRNTHIYLGYILMFHLWVVMILAFHKICF